MKKSIYIFFFLASALHLFGQDSIPRNILQAIDYSLEKDDYTRGDIRLPQDMIFTGDSKLQISGTFTDNPLKSFDFAKFNANKLSGLTAENTWEYLGYIMSLLELENRELISFENSMTSKEIDAALGVKLDSILQFIPAAVLRQYITPLVKINMELRKDFLGIKSNTLSYLLENADGVIIPKKLEETEGFEKFYNTINGQNAVEDKFFRFAASAKKSKIISYGLSLYSFLLRQVVKSEKSMNIYLENIKTRVIETKLGKIGLGGPEDNTWDGDFIFILDIGGNDKYIMPSSFKTKKAEKLIRYIVDLNGNDTYTGGDFSYGSGYGGINILMDMNGNDTYKTGNFSLGCGVFGVGILHDFSGDDKYYSGFSSQGSAAFGVGLLIDGSGNDVYESMPESQGSGFTKGFGLLLDLTGNDIYKSLGTSAKPLNKWISFSQGSARGIENKSAGGIGLLFDLQGDDTYTAGAYSQGSADNYGVSALFDRGGNDNYASGFNSKGYGNLGGIGIFADSEGNDKYTSEFNSYGKSQQYGSGLFFDLSGNDSLIFAFNKKSREEYTGSSVFVNFLGNDYCLLKSTGDTATIKHLNETYAFPSVFVNTKDSSFSRFEKFVDSVHLAETSFNCKPQTDFYLNFSVNSQRLDESPVSSDPEMLFTQAITNLPTYKLVSNNAKNALKNSGQELRNIFIGKINSKDKETKKILPSLFNIIYSSDSLGIVKLLEDSLKTKDFDRLANSSELLATVKSQKVKELINTLLNEKHWKKKVLAIKLIRILGDSVLSQLCYKFAKDVNPYIRAEAGMTISRFMPINYFEIIKPFIEDDKAIVRQYTLNGISMNSVDYLKFKTAFNELQSFKLKRTYAAIIKSIDTKTIDLEDFHTILNENPPQVRESFYLSILESGKEFWRQDYANILNLENEENLKALFPLPEPIHEEQTAKKKRKKK